jgi:hypothetical protein
VPAWIPYTLLRLALFGGTFALVFVLLQRYGLPTMMVVLVAAIAAVIVSLTVAYIFFPSLRDRVSTEFAASRDRSREKAGIAPDGDARGIDERAEDGD